jgi:hypothetical protein
MALQKMMRGNRQEKVSGKMQAVLYRVARQDASIKQRG